MTVYNSTLSPTIRTVNLENTHKRATNFNNKSSTVTEVVGLGTDARYLTLGIDNYTHGIDPIAKKKYEMINQQIKAEDEKRKAAAPKPIIPASTPVLSFSPSRSLKKSKMKMTPASDLSTTPTPLLSIKNIKPWTLDEIEEALIEFRASLKK